MALRSRLLPPVRSCRTLPKDFLKGEGELAARIRSFDWTSTTLGPIERWPQSLETVTELIVNSPAPIVLLCGEDGYMIQYSYFAGGGHPQLPGSETSSLEIGALDGP